MTQPLRALSALLEDRLEFGSQLPRDGSPWPVTPDPGGSGALFWPLQAPTLNMYMSTHRYTYITYIKYITKEKIATKQRDTVRKAEMCLYPWDTPLLQPREAV